MIVLLAALHLAVTPPAFAPPAFTLADYTPDKPLPKLPLTRDYLAFCDKDAKGCSDYLFDYIWNSTVGPQHVGYCLPDQGSPESITEKVTAWLRAHPKLADQPTNPSLTKALNASYPCR